MPPVSKKQAGLFRAAERGDVKLPGLSRAEAHEYVSGYPVKNLPKRVKPKPKKKKPAPLSHPKAKPRPGVRPESMPSGRNGPKTY